MKKREEVLIIYIKSVLQVLFSSSIFILIFNKEWIIGTRNNSETSILGLLDEFCFNDELKFYSENFWKYAEGITGKQARMEIYNSRDLFNSEVSNKKLEPDLVYDSLLKSKYMEHLKEKMFDQNIMDLLDKHKLVRNNYRKLSNRSKLDYPILSFDKIQYCVNYSNFKTIKEWFIHPNYLNYINIFLIYISMILSLNLIKIKNKWSSFELFIPLTDFLVFIVSLINIAQILHILTPLINYLQKHSFQAYFSTNFFIASFSIGGFFLIFVLSIGIIHYRYEGYVKLKRFEDHIENIQTSSSLIHIISNK